MPGKGLDARRRHRGWRGACRPAERAGSPRGPGQGGIRTRPPRHLRLPRRARGAADVLRIDVLRGALHAAVLRLGRGGSRAGLAPGPVSAAAVLAPRLNGVFRPGRRGQRRGSTSAGCVTGWPKQSRQARSPPPWRGAVSGTKKVKMAQGTVKWFNGDKGYGFIAVDGGPDVFVHFSAITGGGYRNLEEGQKVGSTSPRARRGPRRRTSRSSADAPAATVCPEAGQCLGLRGHVG